MRTIILFIFIFSYCISCKDNTPENEKAGIDTSLRILSTGILVRWEKENARHVVSQRWGFEFMHIGGCGTTKQLLDSIKTNNELVESKLRSRHGTNWNIKFLKEVDVEDSIEQIAGKAIDSVAAEN